ncbi:peritrophin-1-like [Culex pipiens pallens]|uniref:peritrophin-1-like n=1 Tax=Culex pipiens pallens TaxID=42434 RepID=UPI0022AA89B9|nr:peritrophin-1-like [Culex pipiens pallens]
MKVFPTGLVIFLLVTATALALDYPRECPSAAEEDPWHPVHLPHPTDCSKFYKCFKGQKHEQVCPGGLHWNIERDYCDYPEEAKCVRPLPYL